MIRSAILVILTVTFVTESLFPNADLLELTKIPELLKHFEDHKQENPSITLLEFLHLHYADSHHANQDRPLHQKLPFSKHNQQHSVSLQVIQSFEEIKSSQNLTLLRKIEFVLYSERTWITLPSTVWQPPRLA